jgi:hypothetical protein
MKREHLGAVLIGLMACATMAGSVSGLVHFAEIGKAGEINGIPVGTIAFVAGLDGLAISLTILAHRKGSTDWLAFGGLVAATLVSTVLQVAAVWDQGPAAIIVHGSPAPCTGVAAFFLLRSLGHAEGVLPEPPAESTGGLKDETSASEREGASAAQPPATEVPLTSGTERRLTSSAPVTQGSGGRKGRGRCYPPPAPPSIEGKARLAAVWLAENERTLSARSVEEAVRASSGSCGRETRDEVYALLSAPDGLDIWTETSATFPDTNSDHSHASDLTIGDHDAS